MQRIQDPDALVARPAVPTLTGNVGYFTNGNPQTAVPATPVPDWYLNMLQEEACAILTAAGLPLDGTATVLQAVEILIGRAANRPAPILMSFTNVGATQFVIPPGNYTNLKLRVWGAGGSGGGSSSLAYPGGGAGAGAYGETELHCNSGDVIEAVVGGGVVAGPGGTSAVTSNGNLLINCTGGAIGQNGSSGAVGSGGGGGIATGGQVSFNGNGGTTGIVYGSSGAIEGGSGAAGFGSEITRAVGSASAGLNANPGAYPGGGATGGTQNTAAGANGLIILEIS